MGEDFPTFHRPVFRDLPGLRSTRLGPLDYLDRRSRPQLASRHPDHRRRNDQHFRRQFHARGRHPRVTASDINGTTMPTNLAQTCVKSEESTRRSTTFLRRKSTRRPPPSRLRQHASHRDRELRSPRPDREPTLHRATRGPPPPNSSISRITRTARIPWPPSRSPLEPTSDPRA